ncbi:MAG: hypothetical protein GY809_15820 [Planctomycetes bacterium]|nr:hypothetical protein [Planctomycetota bacterium]
MKKTHLSIKLSMITLCSVWLLVSYTMGDANAWANSRDSGDGGRTDDFETAAEPLSADLYVVFHVKTLTGNSIIRSGDVVRCFPCIENIGNAVSDSFTFEIYAGGYLLATVRGNPPLAPNAYSTPTMDLAMPDDIPKGSYSFRVKVTCSNDHDLFKGENVASYGTYYFRESKPANITIRSVRADVDIYRPNDPISIALKTWLYAGYFSTDYNVDFYASVNSSTVEGAYHLGTGSGHLDPNTEDTVVVKGQFATGMPEDSYYILALVTWQGTDGLESCLNHPTGSVWVGPSPDLEATSVMVVEGTYGPGEDIVIYSLVQNIADGASGPYTIDYYASVDSTISTSDYHLGYVDRDSLEPGGQHSYNTTVTFPINIREESYYIGVIVQSSQLELGLKNNKVCSEATVHIVPSARYVSGKVQYRNFGDYPVRYARVEIYEDDHNANPLDDHVILETNTDHDGYYGILLPDRVYEGQKIHVRVFAQGAEGAYPESSSRICRVKDDVFGEIYYMQSPAFPYPQDDSLVIDMKALEEDGDGEFMVYDSIVEGFHQARTFFEIEPAEVTAFWPSSEGSYYDPCDLTIHIAQDDRHDRDVIMHEYGHYVADVARFGQGSVGDNPNHYWDRDLRYNPVSRTAQEARNLAFREAWASLFSIATQHGDTWGVTADTRYDDRDEASGYVFSIDLERDTKDHDWPGEFHGNMNCCALWDIFDDYNFSRDDNDVVSDVSLTKIWTICREYRPDDIIDFWQGWVRHFPDEQPEDMMRLFADHEMPFNYQGP